MRYDIESKKDTILNMITNGDTKASMCEFLNCKFSTLQSYLKSWGIVYNGRQNWSKGISSCNKKSAIEFIKTSHNSPKIRKKLIEDGLKEHRCEMCGLSEWLGNPIPLELHHEDGNRFNNDIDNLKILCPTCHSLTPNHSKQYIPKPKKKFYCNCGNEIVRTSKTCTECYAKSQRRVERPELDVLLNDVKSYGYSATGRKYGVSDNMIRKWFKQY